MNRFGTIDICLTSISSRIGSVELTLRSLLAQDYDDVHVRLYLSREPYLLDEGVPELPAALVELAASSRGRLEIVYTRNTGPYRKLIPFLQAHWGQSRLVVTVDDDTIYPRDWLSGLLAAYELYGCSVAYRGHRVNTKGDGFAPYRSWMKNTIEENPSLLILPTGKDGILYDTAFLPINILNMTDALRLAPTADDLWFRWNLAMNGVQVYVINTDYRTAFEETGYDSSLYLNYNRDGRNDTAIQALHDYFKDHHRFSLAEVTGAG